jgi:epsilon-lactone hydrolase
VNRRGQTVPLFLSLLVGLLGVSALALDRDARARQELGYPIYVPDTISSQARKVLESASPTSGRVPLPNDLAGWKKLQADAARIPASDVARIATEDHIVVSFVNLGGVPVLDVRPRTWKDDRRAIVFIHGGAFVGGSARTSIRLSGELSAASGERVISVDYSLSPEAKWSDIQAQLVGVFAALHARGYAMKGLAIAGDSAGGNLAVETVLNLRDRGLGMPAAAILMSPWVDLTDRGDTMHTLAGEDPVLSYQNSLENAAKAYASGLTLSDPRVSPIYADFKKGFCPTLIQEGTKTILMSGSVRLYRELDAAQQHPTIDMYEGMWHAFQYNSVPESQIAFSKSAAFIRQYLH